MIEYIYKFLNIGSNNIFFFACHNGVDPVKFSCKLMN